MCEIARNSVLQSGWELQIKKRWLGNKCSVSGPAGNDISRSNVPNIRSSFRYQTLMEERLMVLNALRDIDTSNTCLPDYVTEMDGASSIFENPMDSPKQHFSIEPLISRSPDYKSRKSSLLKDFNGKYLDLGSPAIPIISGAAGTSGFPAISILSERKARGQPGHDGEEAKRNYNSNSDYDEIFE